MKRLGKGRRGSITLFLCIVLSAAIVLESIYIRGAYQRKAEVLLTRAVSHQSEQILSQFNRDYLDWYGIYVLDEICADHAVFDEMTKGHDNMSFNYQLTDEFSNEDLRTSIIEFMRLRGLAFEGSGILDRLGFSVSKINGSANGSSGLGAWLPTFEDYIVNREKYADMWAEIEEKCKENGYEEELPYFYSFVDDLDGVMKRNISAVTQIGDTSVALSLFDPSCVGNLTDAMDQYMDFDMPGVLERLLINEYAAFSFDSRVTSYEQDEGSIEESNIVGIPFSKIHGDENTCDLEYLLVGNDSKTVNKVACYAMILATRLILDYCAYIMDSTMRNIALAIASVISVLVSVCSLFIVSVDPVAIQYAILFFMAFIKAVSDTGRLVAGKSVPVFYNDSLTATLGEFSDTNYRDYFRIFLLMVPENTLLDRMNTVISRDCGDHLYTGVDAEGQLNDEAYRVKRRFELYENR